MTSSPELPVPDAALDAFTATDPMAYGDTEAMVRAIAGPVVAAELRRMADGYAAGDTISESFARDLRARADQLDSPVSSR